MGRFSAADRFSASAFVAGLLGWYAGGAGALDRLIDAGRLTVPIGATATVAALVAAGRSWDRRGLETAAVVAAATALCGVVAVPVLNQLGGGPARQVDARVEAIVDPSKGPTTAALRNDAGLDERVAVRFAPGCAEGDAARVTIATGALGLDRIVSVACP
jgi:hypothetical protein